MGTFAYPTYLSADDGVHLICELNPAGVVRSFGNAHCQRHFMKMNLQPSSAFPRISSWSNSCGIYRKAFLQSRMMTTRLVRNSKASTYGSDSSEVSASWDYESDMPSLKKRLWKWPLGANFFLLVKKAFCETFDISQVQEEHQSLVKFLLDSCKEWTHLRLMMAAGFLTFSLLFIPSANAVDALKTCVCLLKECRYGFLIADCFKNVFPSLFRK